MLLPQSKYDEGTHCKHWLLHGENVVFHSLHVERVLALVGRKEFAPSSNVGNFGYAFHNDRFLRALCTDDAVRVVGQIESLA